VVVGLIGVLAALAYLQYEVFDVIVQSYRNVFLPSV